MSKWVLTLAEPDATMFKAAFVQANESLKGALGNMRCTTDEERSAHSIGPLYTAMLAARPEPPDVVGVLEAVDAQTYCECRSDDQLGTIEHEPGCFVPRLRTLLKELRGESPPDTEG